MLRHSLTLYYKRGVRHISARTPLSVNLSLFYRLDMYCHRCLFTKAAAQGIFYLA